MFSREYFTAQNQKNVKINDSSKHYKMTRVRLYNVRDELIVESHAKRGAGVPAPADRRVQPHAGVGRQARERRRPHGGKGSGDARAFVSQIRLAVRISHVQSRSPLGRAASRAESCVLRHLLRPRTQALHRLAQHV